MGYESQREAIADHFNTEWASATPIQWEGVPFEASESQPYAKFTIIPNVGERVTLGASSEERFNDIIQIDINVPLEGSSQISPEKTVSEYADTIMGIFMNQTIETTKFRGVNIFKDHVDGWLRWSLAFDTERDESFFVASGGGDWYCTVKEGGVQVGGDDIETFDFDGDHFDIGEDPDTEVNITLASPFTSAEKTKLTGVATGADVTGSNAPQAHEASHGVGGSDTILPADPGADRYLKWDDDPGELVWDSPVGSGTVDTSGSPIANDIARFTGATTIEGRSYAELRADLSLEIGTDVLAQQTIGIADNNLLEVDDADAADNDFAKFTANGLEGRSYAEVRSDINVADGADVTGSNAPQAHHDSHDPEDGSDALDCAAPSELANVQASGEGSSHSFARADHAHQIQHSIANNHIVTMDDADAADNDYARFTADGIEGRNYSEVRSDLGLVIGTNVLAEQTIGIADNNLVEIDDADAADNDYARFTANGLEGRDYSQVRSDLGLVIGTDVLAEQDIGITDNDLVEIDDADVADDDYAKFTANGLEGRSYAEVRTDLGLVIGTNVLAEQTIGIANNNLLEVDDTDAADNDYAKFTANGLEGRSYTEVRSDLNVDDGADVTGSNAPQAHEASHDVGGGDTIFPADPGSDQYLKWDDDPGVLVWDTPGGSGDVNGPGSSINNAIARFDGTTGKLLQDYTSNAPTISDTGDMNIDGDIDVDNVIVSGNVDGRDVSVDGSKLDGIDAGADVTGSNAPQAHASSHQSGGADQIRLDNLQAPEDNTDLDFSTSLHGLVPKGTDTGTAFLRDDGTWATPAGAGTVDTSGTPVDNDFAKFTDADTIEGRSYSEVRTDLGLVIGTNVLAEQTIGIADNNLVEVDDADAADDDYAKFTVNGLEGRSYAEVRTDLGLVIGTNVLAEQTIGIANDNLLEVDDADAADNDYAKFTANGLEGRSYAELLSDISVTSGADVTADNAPQAHHDSHDPEDGSDALDCAAPAELASVQAAGEGSSHSFARADHAHQIQHSIADNHLVTMDDADAADNDFAKFTASGLEGRSYAEVRTDLGLVIGTNVLAEQTIGIADNNLLEVDGSPNDDEYARFTVNGLEGRTESEFKADFNLQIGTDVLAEQAIGIADNNLLEVDGSPNDNEYARFTANGLEGRTEGEFKADFNLEIGTDVLAQQTIGIADNNLLEVDDADAADNDFAKFTANGLEGRSYAEVLTDIFSVDLPEDTSINLDDALSADGTWCGITEDGTAGATLAFGDLCYFAVADSRWELADADAASTGAQKIGICILAAAGDGNATKMLLIGKVRADTAFPTLTVGANVFMGDTAGDIVTTAPSGSGDVVRIMGQGNTANELYFKPDSMYIILS